MRDNKLNPSKALVKKYRKSKTTKTLNLFPSYEELEEKIDMPEWDYKRLKERYRRKIINNKIEYSLYDFYRYLISIPKINILYI